MFSQFTQKLMIFTQLVCNTFSCTINGSEARVKNESIDFLPSAMDKKMNQAKSNTSFKVCVHLLWSLIWSRLPNKVYACFKICFA